MITNSPVPRQPLYGLFALLILGTACSQDPDGDALEKHLRLTRQNPTAPPAYYNLAVAYVQAGRYDEAQRNYAKALDLDPNYALAHDGLGLLAQRRGALEAAAAHFQKAIDLDSTLAAASNNLGNIHYQNGALEKAAAAYQAAVRQAPEHIAFYINFARALRDLRELDQAVAVLLRAVDLDPFSREVHAALGHLYAKNFRLEAAIAAYGEALRIAPSADLHIRIGDVYTRVEKLDEAVREYARAMELDRDNAEARYKLGAIYASYQRIPEAVASAEKSRRPRLDPDGGPAALVAAVRQPRLLRQGRKSTAASH